MQAHDFAHNRHMRFFSRAGAINHGNHHHIKRTINHDYIRNLDRSRKAH